jgi:hypothetical protein
MKLISKLAATSLLLGAVATSAPVFAVSYDSNWFANRVNSAGTTFAVLPTHANHFCFLTTVGVRETDTAGELAKCQLRRSGAVWLLEAILGTSSDADIYCSAYCYNN